MDRRNFIKSLAVVAAYAILPKIAEAKVYPSDVYLPSGTEIREVGTDDLICTVKTDLIRGVIMSPESFNWNWPKPELGSAVDLRFAQAIDDISAKFKKEQARLTAQ